MKRLLLFLLLSFVFLPGAFLIGNFLLLKINPRVGSLDINVKGQKAQIVLNGKEIGSSRYSSSSLPTGDHEIRILGERTDEIWKTNTTLSPTTLSVLDLDLAPVKKFSSGEHIYFRPGETGGSIITSPPEATIFINKKEKGKSPLNLSLENGIQILQVKKSGYLTREIPVNIEPGYKLSALIYLAVDPFESITKTDGGSKISLFIIQNSFVDLSNNYSEWVEGIKHTQKNLGETQTRFDVIIDPSGKVYILDEKSWKNKVSSKAVSNVGYLTANNSQGLSEKANQEWQKLKALFE